MTLPPFHSFPQLFAVIQITGDGSPGRLGRFDCVHSSGGRAVADSRGNAGKVKPRSAVKTPGPTNKRQVGRRQRPEPLRSSIDLGGALGSPPFSLNHIPMRPGSIAMYAVSTPYRASSPRQARPNRCRAAHLQNGRPGQAGPDQQHGLHAKGELRSGAGAAGW